MPGKIQILPESVSQAIAAGEVVERPASVIKELVENAIDAGGTEIVVELKKGGLQLIRVIDNGEGIDRDDVQFALYRYATSKIQRIEDLYAVHTLGFRGEALASIASVSKMTLHTRTPHAISGTRVVCEEGQIKSISEIGCPVGTEVEVTDLFCNLPVRRKFLKSIRTELRYSLNHFLRLSLSYPFISFKFTHDGRTLYDHLKTESPLVRIEAILGREVYDHLQGIEFEAEGIRISGFVSLPNISKGTADGIYLYVNRRFVKDRMVHRAVMEAYRHILPASKFPIVILFLSMPPSTVDVNVHPTKAEVKFKDPERIFGAVLHSIQMAQEENPKREGELHFPEVKERIFQGKTSTFSSFRDSREPYLPLMKGEEGERIQTTFDSYPHVSPFHILGQIGGTYLVCEREGGLIFIDQHAAHERILFEKFKKEYDTHQIASEKLLLPILIELSAEESFLLDSVSEAFQAIGFEIEPIGEKLYAIRSIPSWIGQKDPKGIVREILEELSFTKGGGKGEETVHPILVTLACHTAIRGNFTLRREETEELVKQLHPFNLSTTCPHGRPIFFVLSQEELAKQFKRKS